MLAEDLAIGPQFPSAPGDFLLNLLNLQLAARGRFELLLINLRRLNI